MKKILLTGVAGLAMVAAAPVSAEPDGPYIAGDIGYHWPNEFETTVCTGVIAVFCTPADVELSNGWTAFGRFGTRVNSSFRIEGELGYRDTGVENVNGVAPATDIDGHVWSAMANAMFDFGSGRARPFVGAGVGWGSVTLDDGTDELDDSGLAWQVLAGLAMQTGPRGNIDITYRYFNISDVEMGDGTPTGTIAGDFSDHSITIGYRHSFGAI
ncbi:MAG TPA: porin family protein, partial [Brevundimonas sp.]|uniref:outer membrane protein n=1 Tax=Brevundimonas sp. TaxID=1871086 RepID=UPI002CC93B4E